MANIKPLVIIGVNEDNHQMVIQVAEGTNDRTGAVCLLADAIKLLVATRPEPESPIITPKEVA